MAKRIPERELEAIEAIVRRHPEGVGIRDIVEELGTELPRRTLQYRLKYLLDRQRLVGEGEKRWVKYRIPSIASQLETGALGVREPTETETAIALSKSAAAIQDYVRRPVLARKPVGYNREFLDAYRPNVSAYLSEKERERLRQAGTTPSGEQQPAGTHAMQILNRLLIDLSWNSSRLEGNTYSLLDTKRLIHFGKEAQGKERLEAQMILNHKDAIEFIVDSAENIRIDRQTVLNLHALLAANLLPDPEAPGRLRRMAVGIAKSVFHPLEMPQLIEACFDQAIEKAAAIEDPFEQSFFVMVQLPYLQPFDDVNKRVSRLAANIPLIKANLTPLSFAEVPKTTYTEAILGVYELNEVDLLKELFIWAYERSASRYAAVRQSLGEPDPFRLTYRLSLREAVSRVVRQRMTRPSALAFIEEWANENVDATDRATFREVAENELLSLHEGNFARYRLKPSEFEAWQEVWSRPL